MIVLWLGGALVWGNVTRGSLLEELLLMEDLISDRIFCSTDFQNSTYRLFVDDSSIDRMIMYNCILNENICYVFQGGFYSVEALKLLRCIETIISE